jgi:hypothetical protein
MVRVLAPSGWITCSAHHRMPPSVAASLMAGADTAVPMEKKQGYRAEVGANVLRVALSVTSHKNVCTKRVS